jgi:hypothetical protein
MRQTGRTPRSEATRDSKNESLKTRGGQCQRFLSLRRGGNALCLVIGRGLGGGLRQGESSLRRASARAPIRRRREIPPRRGGTIVCHGGVGRAGEGKRCLRASGGSGVTYDERPRSGIRRPAAVVCDPHLRRTCGKGFPLGMGARRGARTRRRARCPPSEPSGKMPAPRGVGQVARSPGIGQGAFSTPARRRCHPEP